MYSEENYRKEQKEQIARAGFALDELTQEQIEIVLEPIEAPENYACDGEITAQQALIRWSKRMTNSGMNYKQRWKATKFIFG